MVAYTFDSTAHEKNVQISGQGWYARLTIYEYLGHPLRFYYNSVYTDPFYGVIVGSGPEQYEFVCLTNQTDLYNKHLSILDSSGPKHVNINADSAIPPEGPFAIPITSVTVSSELFFVPARVIPDALIQLMPAEWQSIIGPTG